MSRNGTRDTNLVPKDKVPAFMKLVDSLIAVYGSRHAACKAIGIVDGHLSQVQQGEANLSVTYARKILAAYKALKNPKEAL